MIKCLGRAKGEADSGSELQIVIGKLICLEFRKLFLRISVKLQMHKLKKWKCAIIVVDRKIRLSKICFKFCSAHFIMINMCKN